jgi:hypothetical protein
LGDSTSPRTFQVVLLYIWHTIIRVRPNKNLLQPNVTPSFHYVGLIHSVMTPLGVLVWQPF